jgi:hypothetical protein
MQWATMNRVVSTDAIAHSWDARVRGMLQAALPNAHE